MVALLSVSIIEYITMCTKILKEEHCIIRHSLRYFRHSGPVIYKSKLPAPSFSMPCESRILQSPTKEQVKLVLYETRPAVSKEHCIIKKEVATI